MKNINVAILLLLLLLLVMSPACFGLEADEILVIANKQIEESVQLADYYCNERKIPKSNILLLGLGSTLDDSISRSDYQRKLAEPVIEKLTSKEFAGRIKCLVITYGVPFKISKRPTLEKDRHLLDYLSGELERLKIQLQQLDLAGGFADQDQKKQLQQQISHLVYIIAPLKGEETNASVDSELSMALFGDYDLYRWQPNRLNAKSQFWDYKSLMVSRLDGPSFEIAKGLIDKAIAAEKNGLEGKIYIDSRGIADDGKDFSFGNFDQSLRDLSDLLKSSTEMAIVEEKTQSLFGKNECPDTAIYCGWYSLKKYIDSFTFNDGAIGYHIASWEAIDLRDAKSSQWCPAMLSRGVTVTIGAVAEPYLHAFPKPDEFFAELLKGFSVTEAFYRTKSFNSWQLVIVADPLYTPFETKR